MSNGTMNSGIDYASFELGIAKPRLRADVRFSLRKSKHGATYLIEDETNSKFYRVGIAEYTFLSLLDGNTSVQSAVAATAAKLGIEAFTEAEAAALCKWLIDAGLADKKRHDQQNWQESQAQKQLAQRMQWINPIMLKLPIGNPDKVVTRVAKHTSSLVSRPAFYVWILVCLVAIVSVITRSDELFGGQSQIFARDNWLWLGLIWMLLRVAHESAHALVCKAYGGRVRQWGVLFLLFIPLPYVDVTSSWRFPRRSARILTSAAGMMVELFLAAIAALVWIGADPGLLRQNAVNVMLAASITTLLFNANPLMRFDGYHILVDFLDMPNLWTHGRAFMRTIGRKWFYNLGSGKPAWRSDQARVIGTYGVASTIWKVLIFVSLTLGACSLLEGIGLIFAFVAAIFWIGIPAFRLLQFVAVGTETEQPDRQRFAIVTSAIAFTCVVLAIVVPAPSIVTSPIVIEHDPLTVVRNDAGGFIDQFEVDGGQLVAAGDVVCRLKNVELQAQAAELQAQLNVSQQRMRAYQSAAEPAAAQIEFESVQDLSQRLSEVREMVSDLVIRAEADGVIVNRDLDQRIGTYLQPGSEIVTIGGTASRKAIAMVSQDESNTLEQLDGKPASMRVWGTSHGVLTGTVTKVHPRAQTALPHFSFAAPAGGDLAVVAALPQEDRAIKDSQADNWMLAKPHVKIEIKVGDAVDLQTGQTGQVSIRAREGTFGGYVITGLTRFLQRKITRTHGL